MKKQFSLLIVVLMLFAAAGQAGPVLAGEYDDASRLTPQLNATTRPDHVTLSWSADPRSTMTISWRTSTAVSKCRVEYSEANSGHPVAVEGKPELFRTVEKDPDQGEMNLFTVTLTALKSGVTYTYRIGNDRNEWTDAGAFTTESPETVLNNRFTFLVFGDSQSGKKDVPDYNDWHETVQKAYAANRDARFIINMGDLVETGQSYRHWQNWFSSARGVIDRVPEMPVEGNHETYNAKDFISTRPVYYIEQFRVFENGPAGLTRQVYSFNYGKVHFVVLDSQGEEESRDVNGKHDPLREKQFYAAQTAWLRKDLERNRDALFTFVFFHKTPYYNKGNRSNDLLKETFCPLFDEYHVDVVFSGHDHAISRTYPLRNDKIVKSPAEGTIYYITGRSGAKRYSGLWSKSWNAWFHNPRREPNYQKVELDGSRLTIKAFTQSGRLLDTYVIEKKQSESKGSD